jgi:hypothetical protein
MSSKPGTRKLKKPATNIPTKFKLTKDVPGPMGGARVILSEAMVSNERVREADGRKN